MSIQHISKIFKAHNYFFQEKRRFIVEKLFSKKAARYLCEKEKNRIKPKKNETAIRKSKQQVFMILVKKITKF